MASPYGSTRACRHLRPYRLIAYQAPALYDPLHRTGAVPVAREQRKLAAILAADVVGCSRLMGRDKSGSLTRLCGNAISDGQRSPAHI
jgi:class 3 adenylate cyclase